MLLTPKVFYLFLAYLSGFIGVIAAMFGRVEILSAAAWILRRIRLSATKQEVLRGQEQRILHAVVRQDGFDEDSELLSTDLSPSETYQPEPEYIKENEKPSIGGLSPQKVFAWTDEFLAKRVHMHLFSPDRRPSLQPIPTSEGGLSDVTRTHRSDSTAELMQQLAQEHRWASRWLRYCLLQVEAIVAQPFAYLCKSPDPIALHQALEYIVNNEVSNHIYVIHFIDDRPALYAHNQLLTKLTGEGDDLAKQSEPVAADEVDIEMSLQTDSSGDVATKGAQWLTAKFTATEPSGEDPAASNTFTVANTMPQLPTRAIQLIRLVNIVDTLYTYKKVSCIVVRGMFFCPRAVATVSEYLKIGTSNMIMGTFERGLVLYAHPKTCVPVICLYLGVPDTSFPFPIAELHGVRLAVPDVKESLRTMTYRHLRAVMRDTVRDMPSVNMFSPDTKRVKHDNSNQNEGQDGDSFDNDDDDNNSCLPEDSAAKELFSGWDYTPDDSKANNGTVDML